MRYDAVAFLKGLYEPAPKIAANNLPTEWQDRYRERRAILEVSGGLPPELAEHYALLDTLEVMRTWDKYPTY